MSAPLRIGSLFSGIDGLSLGLERGIGNGAHTVFQVEQNAYCRAVLAKHWPDALRFDDVRTVGAANLPRVDLLCGGPPCQDNSSAGKQAGIDGPQSVLWREFTRIVGELQPRIVVLENVWGIMRGYATTAAEFTRLGYRVTPVGVTACLVGAAHARRRVFLVADAYPDGQPARPLNAKASGVRAYAERLRHGRQAIPRVVRMADGVPSGLDRLRALGNAVHPDCAAVVGRLIAEREAQQVAA